MSTSRIRRACAWLVTAGLTLGGATLASADRYPGSAQPAQRQQAQKPAQQGKQQAKHKALTVGGRVIATKSVQLKGTDQRHLVALIRTKAGQRRVIDLGPRRDADKLQLAVGDQLMARGHVAEIGGRRILIAKQARTPEQTLTINRAKQRMHFDRAVRQAHQGMSCPPGEG